MKKILASILASFFVVLSPISAYAAATTESMMMYASVDEYAVMPLDLYNSYDFSVYTGVYNKATEQFDFNSHSFSDISNGDILVSSWSDLATYIFTYNPNLMASYGFSFGEASQSSSISIPDGSTLSFELAPVTFNGWDFSAADGMMLYNASAVPYRVFADMYFTATQQYGNTHSSTYHSQTIEITQFMNPTPNTSFRFDVNFRVPISADTSWFTGDNLYNINLRYIKVYAVYPLQNNFIYSNAQLPMTYNNGNTYSLTTSFLNESTFVTRPYFTYVAGNGSVNIDTSTNAIQSSISSLSNNMSNQFSNVKTQISQSTNTITTKIDTMSQDIQTGLSNVVESAKQNTQNIINTVTQKVDQVKETVTEVKDSILDLPNKIQEMLLGLIVPDSDTMADKYSEFSGLLEEKLGVIYQIPMMLFDFFDTIVNAATTPQTTLTLPAFQLPWIDGSTLTVWQPMEYKIIPEGMQVLSDLIKTITSMTVVVLTFNSVKRAYERFLRS